MAGLAMDKGTQLQNNIGREGMFFNNHVLKNKKKDCMILDASRNVTASKFMFDFVWLGSNLDGQKY